MAVAMGMFETKPFSTMAATDLFNLSSMNSLIVSPIGFNGISAGNATTNDITLWTRTYDKLDSSERTGASQPVTVEIATDAAFANTIYTGSQVTKPENDYTVKFTISGLNPYSTYYYRFSSPSGTSSEIGRFKTTPEAGQTATVRIGHSGDVDGLMRPYPLVAGLALEKFDSFIFNGDTIYETASSGSAATPATKDAELGSVTQQVLLDAYRRKYLENLLPAPGGTFHGLKDFFASTGILFSFDNHELGNKALINGGAPYDLRTSSANGTANVNFDVNSTGQYINDTNSFETLLRAFSDYMPGTQKTLIAPNDSRSDGELQFYGVQSWGKNAVILNLDTRSFRDVRLNKSTGGDDTGPRADNPNRTMLGMTQKAWLKQSLLDAKTSGVQWKIINTSSPIDMIGAYGTGEDGGKSWWGGYRAERNEILKFIADNDIKNVVFLASDDHMSRVNELTYMPDPSKDPSNPNNYKVLDGVLSIVDGPMGATGPDFVTDHQFENIKALADALALRQQSVGINPIGLEKSFVGLSNVYREGDPTASINPKPVDFYSPDSFNYLSLEINSSGTLNVSLRGINSYPQNSFPEPGPGNPVRTIYSFTLDPIVSTYNLSAPVFTATEPLLDGALASAKVRVTRSGDTSAPGSVELQLTDITAKGAPAAPPEGLSTGPSTSTTPYVIPTPGSGVAIRSLLTTGDSVGGYTMAGIPDGLGAFDNGDGTFTLLMNHEFNNTVGVVRAHGGKGAFVSSWVINKSDLRVIGGSDLIQNVYGWDASTQASKTTPNNASNSNGISFYRFCSADLPSVGAFYNPSTGKGTQARLFLNGEEGGSTGYAMANVATGSAKGNSYVLGKFNLSTNGSGLTGVGGWENLLANPFPQDKTVVIGNNDGGTGLMSGAVAVYVGSKTTSGTEADKAGLTNGMLQFVNVAGNPAEIINNTTQATNITSGSRFSLSATASTAFARPEDGAWDPNDPRKYYFVTTNRLDTLSDGVGTQIGMTRLWRLTFDDITNPQAGGTIDLLIDGDMVNGRRVNMFDNITIDNYGHILLQEDVGNAAHNGKIWQYDIATDSLELLAKHDPARFGDIGTAPTPPFSIDEETSGIIDLQDILGAGSFAFVDQAHYSTGNATTVEGGQLLLMFNPSTLKSYQPDYINSTQVVNFSAGESFKDISIPIYGDKRIEGQESLMLKLANPSAGTVVGSLQPSASLIINDAPATLSVAPLMASQREGNIGSTPFTFSVTREGDPTASVSFAWSVVPTGINPASADDFAGGVLPGGMVQMLPGQLNQQISVDALGDNTFERNETFSVKITEVRNGEVKPGANMAAGEIQNDDLPTPTYTITATPNPVYEGGTFSVSLSTSNVAAGTPVFWSMTGSGITSGDITDGAMMGVSLIGADGRAAFSKSVAADGVIEGDETLELRFFTDSLRTQQVGSLINVMLKEPTVGVVTDGNDIITGGHAAERITGVPTPSSLRGRGSVDMLTGGGGNDIFVLGDSQGIYYDDGTSGSGSTDLAVITDFAPGDKIQLYGNSNNYILTSGRYNGIKGLRIDSLTTLGAQAEVIGFIQGATLPTFNLSNSTQFIYA